MSDKPLIAHVLYRLDTGGMERIVVSLIKATHARYRHAVITLAGFGMLRDEIADVVVACVSLEKRPGTDWRCYLRLQRALRLLKPDLVQTYNLGTLDLAPVVKAARVRHLVHAEHGRDAADPDGSIRKYQRLRRWMAPFIDRYVAVSPDLRDWLTERVRLAPAKVTYIANGIDVAAFAASRPRSVARTLLDDFAPAGSVLIGNVARLDLVKDHASLLAAFKLLRAQAPRSDCRLVIIGDGPQRDTLARQIAQLGLAASVRLLGNRSDVAALLGECDLFALSSIAEGMPVTVLEAMAAGLPVVATGVGSVATVVADDVTGTLVPVRDPRALADALAMYVDDAALRSRLGEAGRARVTTQFTLAAMVSSYTALYDGLLGARTPTVHGEA
jgi:sugar transferase (PEP-CTERM/EpsH1 system associated)